MKFRLNSPKIIKTIFISLIFSSTFLDLNLNKNQVFANEIIPADKNDLALYEGMGLSYVCQASRKEINLDFEKSLGVAATTFIVVIKNKHGGLIVNPDDKNKKGVEVNPERLFENVTFRILGRAIELCPENVPKKSKKAYEKQVKKLKEFLNKK